jgi:mannitol 2-dehydrogenase
MRALGLPTLRRACSTSAQAVPLNATNLTAISDKICTPQYDRSMVKAGIVHLGVGGFQRSHLAVYTDDVLQAAARDNEKDAMMWGICGVGLLPSDVEMAKVMADQDSLYTLISKQGALHSNSKS